MAVSAPAPYTCSGSGEGSGEGSGGGLVGDFMVDGLIGPVIDIPALVAAM